MLYRVYLYFPFYVKIKSYSRAPFSLINKSINADCCICSADTTLHALNQFLLAKYVNAVPISIDQWVPKPVTVNVLYSILQVESLVRFALAKFSQHKFIFRVCHMIITIMIMIK